MGDVIRLKDPARAFWLTRSVARTAGVNLGNALVTGQIGPADYSDMIVRCRRCSLTEACEAWLGRIPKDEMAPAGCHHAPIITRLSQRHL